MGFFLRNFAHGDILMLLLFTSLVHNVYTSSECNLFEGSWVVDESYPLYDSSQCPFIEREFDCLKNGRPDKNYLKYKWKPMGCDLSRFDGKEFLTRFKGKNVMFVGDSLSLNQWQSLTCMLHIAVPNAKYSLVRNEELSTFSFPDFNVKVMFSRNAFLVDIVSEKVGRVLKLDSLSRSTEWLGIDTLIFNTWHWWLHEGRQQPWDIIQYGKTTVKDMNRLAAYEIALTTWSKWVDSNIDPSKTTRVFFQGISPDHMNGSDWKTPKAPGCSAEQIPVSGSSYPGGAHPAEIVVKRVLRKMSKPAYLLDVTRLSQLRKDGHPSVYGFGGHRNMDCSHWCLAGVPDTWNQLLYKALLRN